MNGWIKNIVKCGCIPTRYYGAQIFLGTQHPSKLDYTKVNVYCKTGTNPHGTPYKTIDVRYAKYMNGPYGKGYYIDQSYSPYYTSKGSYWFAVQAVGMDNGKEITGPIVEINGIVFK